MDCWVKASGKAEVVEEDSIEMRNNTLLDLANPQTPISMAFMKHVSNVPQGFLCHQRF